LAIPRVVISLSFSFGDDKISLAPPTQFLFINPFLNYFFQFPFSFARSLAFFYQRLSSFSFGINKLKKNS